MTALVLMLVLGADAEQRASQVDAGHPSTLNVARGASLTGNADWMPRHDYLDHVAYSALVVLVSNTLLRGLALADIEAKRPSLLSSFWARWALSLVAGAVVGLAKEGLDLLGAGTPELGDLVADGIGIAAGGGVLLFGRF